MSSQKIIKNLVYLNEFLTECSCKNKHFPEPTLHIPNGYKSYISEYIKEHGLAEVHTKWYNYLQNDKLSENKINNVIDHYFKDILGEATYKDLRRDAPNYLNIRTKSKKTKGSRYQDIDENGIVRFRTPSHTVPGRIYTQFVKLLDLDDIIRQYSASRTPIQIARMALAGDIEVHCTDPSWKYWGFQYIGSQNNYALNNEPRIPKIRNPRLQGSVCKHLDNVLFILPFQSAVIGRDLQKLGIL